jgi:hypothetical protein
MSIIEDVASKCLVSGRFEIEYNLLDSVQAATLLTKFLLDNGLLEHRDGDQYFTCASTFYIVTPGFESIFCAIYPDMEVEATKGRNFEGFQMFQDMKVKFRDYVPY